MGSLVAGTSNTEPMINSHLLKTSVLQRLHPKERHQLFRNLQPVDFLVLLANALAVEMQCLLQNFHLLVSNALLIPSDTCALDEFCPFIGSVLFLESKLSVRLLKLRHEGIDALLQVLHPSCLPLTLCSVALGQRQLCV
jgi:hypothetical protein